MSYVAFRSAVAEMREADSVQKNTKQYERLMADERFKDAKPCLEDLSEHLRDFNPRVEGCIHLYYVSSKTEYKRVTGKKK